jgi:DNA-binding GntR family transcriptional regulator
MARNLPTWKLIYQQLRQEIVGMSRKPGDLINEKSVAAERGLSRTPVREAVQRLADEGLVEIFPQSGTFVARIPYDELPEAMVIRTSLEMTAVRLAVRSMTKSQLFILKAIVEEQREADGAGDRLRFHAADERFHMMISEISGYPGIWRVVMQVKTQVDRYRMTTLEHPHRMGQVVQDHERVLEAMEAGDAERAARAMETHLAGVLTSIDG